MLITNVETTLAPVADGDLTPTIHQALARTHLLPEQHLVDPGYFSPVSISMIQHEMSQKADRAAARREQAW